MTQRKDLKNNTNDAYEDSKSRNNNEHQLLSETASLTKPNTI